MSTKDLSSKKLIILIGFLFLLITVLSSALLILRDPSLTTITLLVIAIWGFARFYYFMFYVITNYIDSDYKYSGLISFIKHLWKK